MKSRAPSCEPPTPDVSWSLPMAPGSPRPSRHRVPTAVVVAAIIVFCAAAGYASFRLTVALLRPHYQLVIVSTTHPPKPRRITIRPHPRTSVIYLPAPAPVAPPPAPGPVASRPN